MFRNGILEHGWREKDGGMSMEVKWGCEEVWDLVDEAKERLDLFKDGGSDVA